MEAAGGIISLTWDVFDSTIRVFRFLTAMVEMPRDCEKYRLQLVIEYNRVLAWGKAAGLIDVPEGSSLGAVLGAEGIELVAILARIQWLLSEFREYNARYGNELNPYAYDDDGKQTAKEIRDSDQDKEERAAVDEKATETDADIVKGVSALAVSYEKKKRERRHLKGTNHIRGFLSKAGYHTKDILTHPGRVRWLVIDGEEFQKLLEDLHFLTERLHELMRDHRDKRIDDITAKTYREMILTRNDIQDLRDMFDAVSGLVTSSTRKDITPNHNDKTLQDLVQLKKLSRTSDAILSQLRNTPLNLDGLSEIDIDIDITVTRYTEPILDTDFEWNEDLDHPQFHPRPRGILTTPEGHIPVWVEWKAMGSFKSDSLQDKESALRTVALAEMLHLPKPGSLPTCVGYFDDRHFNDTERYGWIFKMPEGSDYDTRVVSLYSLLGSKAHRPSLSQRITLAEKLCSTVLNIHAVNWLHKGIFSENVVFCFNDNPPEGGVKYDPSSPILSGFEFSRPDGTHTTARDTDIVWDVYRWPGIQRQRPTERNSRKTYDLYSLGLVLLEVAHWEKLHSLMGLGKKQKPQQQGGRENDEERTYPNVTLEESKNVRDWLLGVKTEGAPFEKTGANPLTELRNLVGDRYAQVVERCLWAHGEKGFGVADEHNLSIDGGVALQEAFTERVVEELRAIKI
ncbi:prion-inhibition and propagation-domain-containing protein [Triangularia setosa]|uniref:Prion-inhibition and propagation-domain-containing protein n=1 Tax=Triangularia setosa TaxID=2587417 RepID=A0AAN7A2G3_9PEZI|nr:prion-inhibition and propagation-domain-containing protein [Podospora setosa]